MSLFSNVNVGASANDGSGDPLRDAFIKLNENFALLNQLFSLNGSQFVLSNVAINNAVLTNVEIYTDSYFYANGDPFIGGGGGGPITPPSGTDLEGGSPSTTVFDITVDGGAPSSVSFDTTYDAGGA